MKSGGLLLILCWIMAVGEASAAVEANAVSQETVAQERADLFVGLLKRRAQRILEAYRVSKPPLWSFSTGVGQGYESNVNLDGERRGDSFTEESASLVFHPTLKPWLAADIAYSGGNTHFMEFTDNELITHTATALLQIQPHRSLRLEGGGEYAILNFPRSSDSSFTDSRVKAHLIWAQDARVSHKTGWTYQFREYDTRQARDSAGTRVAGLVREDQRHTGLYELQLRFPKTFLRLAAEFYRNFSNDQSDEFYDWDDAKFRGVLTRVFSSRWVAVLTVGQERKNYQGRSVPAIAVSQRDNLTTLSGSLIYQWTSRATLTYSLTYRYQDSNDPRLDFTDWINQVSIAVSF